MKQILRKIYFGLPAKWRFRMRRLYFLPLDIWDTILFNRNPMVPSRGRIFIGSGDYIKQGELFLNYFKELGGLKPDMRVLDVGCGTGRMALPLTKFFTHGSYEGFDIMKEGINWCNKKIHTRYPHFNFKCIEIANSLYLPNAMGNAAELVFPYEKNEFNFVFLTSVFTHMPLVEIKNYIKEISRVLASGGVCFFTAFLIDTAVLRQIKEGKALMNFPFDHGDYFLHHEDVDAANVAIRREVMMKILEENGFDVPTIYPGRWSGMPNSVDYQDLIVVQKKL